MITNVEIEASLRICPERILKPTANSFRWCIGFEIALCVLPCRNITNCVNSDNLTRIMLHELAEWCTGWDIDTWVRSTFGVCFIRRKVRQLCCRGWLNRQFDVGLLRLLDTLPLISLEMRKETSCISYRDQRLGAGRKPFKELRSATLEVMNVLVRLLAGWVISRNGLWLWLKAVWLLGRVLRKSLPPNVSCRVGF